ncbi:uncharacterized protein MYCGRDRAFT_74100 [Zymoseptoria tritici IPO323]|nr:uncharacterized protein MYCGRDRAFT_74100 [Zymoseptoria tritici IPO323]EGP85713.1 hypothetical protein MYCGRDRAFT_74100 [Zymoseptoria tritici IPO323]
MLKAWLRELPSEMMPASLQKSLAVQLEKENPNYKNVGQPASQLLRDALSDLPPYNYYLLFAITCHLSLLLTNKEVNKMDLNNLAVCVGPCLNLERWLFNYLVGDWRHCWQGCYTEKDYLKIEEMVEAGLEPPHNSHHESYKTPEGEFRDDKSLTQSMWAATLGDDKSATNRSEWATTIGDSSENVSNSDSRAYSNGGGSVHTTSHDDSRSMTSGATVSGRAKQPQTYMPVGAKPHANGSLSSAAEQRHAKDDAVIGTTSNETTPKIGHARSRSDLPPAPVKSNGGGHDGEGAGLYGRG